MQKRFTAFLILAAFCAANRPANAAPVVTVYTTEASFLAAISNPTVLSFEGIAPDNGDQDEGTAYHTGAVTFTTIDSPPGNRVSVLGKNSQSLGAPFTSALLSPESDPGGLIATFDPGANITAVGGFFIVPTAGAQALASFVLTGSSGTLDSRFMFLGGNGVHQTKTFYGYTVTGDTISSLAVNAMTSAADFDDFTYTGPTSTAGNTSAPEPTTLTLLLPLAALLPRRHR